MKSLKRWWWAVLVVALAIITLGALLIPSSRHFIRGLVINDFVFSSVRITYPEGTTIREMAAKTSATFSHIAEKDFRAAAGSSEGYLFPDTYLFSASTSAASIIAIMRKNFDIQTASLLSGTT